MMTIETFLENLKIQFEEDDAEKLSLDKEFETLDTWDSLTQFSIIAFLEDEFNIEFPGGEFKKYNTPRLLYNYVITVNKE